MNPIVPTTRIAGVPISCLSTAATMSLLRRWLGEGRSRRVATANVDFLCRAQQDAALRAALCSADLVTADGMPLVWWSRWTERAVPERVTGSDMLEPLVAAAAQDGRSVYFLGGAPGVAQGAAELLQERHPSLRIAGVDSPAIDLADAAGNRAVAARVRATGASLLLVALGCPKQELFLQHYLAATGAAVGIGVGASFDFLVGRVARAPRAMQKVGLEWLFRAATEPRRLGRRYLGNLPFALRTTAQTVWSGRPAITGSEVLQ